MTPPCNTCHAISGVVSGTTVGPDLAGLADRLGQRAPGQDPRTALKQKITNPAVWTASGFPAGVMPTIFGTQLSTQQLDALVDFLLNPR